MIALEHAARHADATAERTGLMIDLFVRTSGVTVRALNVERQIISSRIVTWPDINHGMVAAIDGCANVAGGRRPN